MVREVAPFPDSNGANLVRTRLPGFIDFPSAASSDRLAFPRRVLAPYRRVVRGSGHYKVRTPVRKAHSNGADTYGAIRAAAVDLIYQYGYNGTSMRMLAAEVGIDQSTLYYHIKSKQNLLYQIITDVREEYMAGLRAALDVRDPEEQLHRFIRYHVGIRFKLKKMSFISATELRSLTPARRRKTLDTQRTVLRTVNDIIDRGIAAGTFDVSDSKVAALAIFQLLNGINKWHSSRGTSTDDRIVEMHIQFVSGLLRSRGLERDPLPHHADNGAGK
jgi:AcrR family transcriptional regulator